mgnify:CR=1 FL=1
MNIIFVGRSHGKSQTIQLDNRHLVIIGLSVLLMLVFLFFAGFQARLLLSDVEVESVLSGDMIAQWDEKIAGQTIELKNLKRSSQEKVDALTLRMGDMQARLLRLDALGQRLTEVAKLKNGEFDFSASPALGGPINAKVGESYILPDLQASLAQIEQQIMESEQQLDVIDALFMNRMTQNELFIAGRPISWGWMSSAYGYRTDPFSGKRAWHAGVDFAGKEDSDIIAVASGVVTFSGDRNGYGNLVEINHGKGFTTRYAHCKSLLVNVGSIVEKGQILASMGSTGRSTGPHVHYEVRKNGKTINPKKYIHRVGR